MTYIIIKALDVARGMTYNAWGHPSQGHPYRLFSYDGPYTKRHKQYRISWKSAFQREGPIEAKDRVYVCMSMCVCMCVFHDVDLRSSYKYKVLATSVSSAYEGEWRVLYLPVWSSHQQYAVRVLIATPNLLGVSKITKHISVLTGEETRTIRSKSRKN